MTEDQIKHMAERFLNWPLPDDFGPDCGITFDPIVNAGTPYEHRHRPVGTNVFTYAQALAMVRHMVSALPTPHSAMPDTKALEADARENIVDEIESIICETHEMDVRDVDYAENIVSWLERHHSAALHAIDATYRAVRGGKA